MNEIIAKSIQDAEMVTFHIDDDVIEQIASLADSTMWMKRTQDGFAFNDKVVSELTGVITHIRLYCVKFDGKNTPEKIDFSKDPPEGFEPRADLKIMVSGQTLGISLPRSSVLGQFAPYLKYLQHRGLNPGKILTRLKTRQVSNKYGVFTVVTFECVGMLPDGGSEAGGKPDYQTVSAQAIEPEVLDAKFTENPQMNPWA